MFVLLRPAGVMEMHICGSGAIFQPEANPGAGPLSIGLRDLQFKRRIVGTLHDFGPPVIIWPEP